LRFTLVRNLVMKLLEWPEMASYFAPVGQFRLSWAMHIRSRCF